MSSHPRELAEATTEGVRSFFTDRHGLDARRRAGDPLSLPGSLLPEAGELGFLGIGIDEELGGSGGSVDLAGIVAEEAGAQLVHGALLHQMVAAFTLAHAGVSPEQVALVASGDRPTMVASDPGMTSTAGALAVPFAWKGADVLVLRAEGAVDRLRSGGYGLELSDGGWLLPLSTEGAISPSGPVEVVTERAGDAWRWRAFADGLAALYALGAAGRLLRETVDYAAARRQFGVPIGTFQAVKHRLADASVELLHARAMALGVLGELGAGATRTARSAAGAKCLADGAACRVAEACLQVSGGFGFTWEADVHLVLKVVLRLRQWPRPAALVRAELRNHLLED